jgi:hypothetical protein
VIKNIGTEEARIEKVIINRGQDATNRMMANILPQLQAKLDMRQEAAGEAKLDVCVLLLLHHLRLIVLCSCLTFCISQPGPISDFAVRVNKHSETGSAESCRYRPRKANR